ncbi:MAG: hypothetical protein HZB70_02645 [Candidatus Berkelbacteria bacterium]|nr:MAG: hypothetical protein HZB70_02645 [Candidatus Berkelbacteria bacterium]QQG51795.1 MAG: hypothetical protein HY845_00350 [Candidatus Berkelbacteria bacterium]
MSSKSIVVTSPLDLSEEQKNRLGRQLVVSYHDSEPATAAEWLERCKGFEFVCSGKSGMTWPVKDDGPKDDYALYHLEAGSCVSFPFVNVNLFPKDRVREAGINLGYAPGCNAGSVAEWVMLAILGIYRLPHDEDGDILQRKRSLIGKKLTVLGGNGHVGKEVIKRAQPFDMEVTNFCRHKEDASSAPSCQSDLTLAVADADVVVNCLSSNPENQGMLNAEFFQSMRSGSVFVTMTSPASTGGVWVIPDLLAALDSNHLYVAAIDIGNRAPGDETAPTYLEVKDHPAILATPQIAHFTDVSAERSFDMMIDNIEAAIKGELMPYSWA